MLTSNSAKERALLAERALLDDLVGPPENRRRDREALALIMARASSSERFWEAHLPKASSRFFSTFVWTAMCSGAPNA